jgi:hypothetical protein
MLALGARTASRRSLLNAQQSRFVLHTINSTGGVTRDQKNSSTHLGLDRDTREFFDTAESLPVGYGPVLTIWDALQGLQPGFFRFLIWSMPMREVLK